MRFLSKAAPTPPPDPHRQAFPRGDREESVKFAIVFWPLLLVVEAAAVYVSYETIGWMLPPFLVLAFLTIDVYTLSLYSHRFRLGIIVGSVLMAIVLQFAAPLGVRWYYVDREAKRIIAWAEGEKTKTGSYPDDLNGYQFQCPGCREYVDYYKDSYHPRMGFGVSYTVGTPGTNHHYDTEGGWYYQDD